MILTCCCILRADDPPCKLVGIQNILHRERGPVAERGFGCNWLHVSVNVDQDAGSGGLRVVSVCLPAAPLGLYLYYSTLSTRHLSNLHAIQGCKCALSAGGVALSYLLACIWLKCALFLSLRVPHCASSCHYLQMCVSDT